MEIHNITIELDGQIVGDLRQSLKADISALDSKVDQLNQSINSMRNQDSQSASSANSVFALAGAVGSLAVGRGRMNVSRSAGRRGATAGESPSFFSGSGPQARLLQQQIALPPLPTRKIELPVPLTMPKKGYRGLMVAQKPRPLNKAVSNEAWNTARDINEELEEFVLQAASHMDIRKETLSSQMTMHSKLGNIK